MKIKLILLIVLLFIISIGGDHLLCVCYTLKGFGFWFISPKEEEEYGSDKNSGLRKLFDYLVRLSLVLNKLKLVFKSPKSLSTAWRNKTWRCWRLVVECFYKF